MYRNGYNIAWAVIVVGGIGIADTAVAQRARGGSTVSGCSKFGNGCISGPVRNGRQGPEVRLPGGTWIGCAGDCRDALRVETIDFWAQRDADRGGGERRRR